MKPILKKGDMFATENPMAMGRIINFFQRNYNRDHKSKYTHAGLIINSIGISFEALWHYERQNIFEAYKDKEIVIFRHKGMTDERFSEGFQSIIKLEGRQYPWYRIPLFMIPILSRFSIIKKPVCSELFRRFIYNAGLFTPAALIRKYISHVGEKGIYGVDPDDLVDMCREDKNYEIIFEGVLT